MEMFKCGCVALIMKDNAPQKGNLEITEKQM